MRVLPTLAILILFLSFTSETRAQDPGKVKSRISVLNKEYKVIKKQLRKNYDQERKGASSAQQDALETAFWKDRQDLKKQRNGIRRQLKKNPDMEYALHFESRSIPEVEERIRENPEGDQVIHEEISGEEYSLIRHAENYLGTPYRYGGTTRSGFDCSGFVQQVFRDDGIQIPRTSKEQSTSGEKVNLKQVTPGDLLFFSHGGSKIDHVGIVTRNDDKGLEMIHCSSSSGVIITEVTRSKYWRPKLKKARRIGS